MDQVVCGNNCWFDHRLDRFDHRLSDIRLALGCGNALTG
jgi:hypothetical protein